MEFDSLVILLAVSGIITVAGIIIQIRAAIRKRTCKSQASGTIVDVEKKISYDSDGERNGSTRETTYYHPVYQYEAGGRTVKVASSFGTARAKYEIGQKVTVFYDPNNAENYYIAGSKAASNFGFIFASFGILCAVLGIAVYVFS